MKNKLKESKEAPVSPTEWPTRKKETFQAWWTTFYLPCKIQKDTETRNDEFSCVEKSDCSAMNSYDFFKPL